ncbi:MAG: hypothetical protein CL674_08790 [Bdellovibrionaceae bacterium]|nr:hypothetical protein [Pseudobdellovibrionaceae bacterium]|tara:strand:+ start:34166 stop:34945 length:780 start_codon:yes stop_codon:yes gene_type:complete
MIRTLFLLSFSFVLVAAFQNCGQISPVHELGDGFDSSSSGSIGSVIGGDYDVDTTEIDAKIAALSKPALETWDNACGACHGGGNNSGGLGGGFDEYSRRIFEEEMYVSIQSASNGTKVNYNESNPMPQNLSLQAHQSQSLIDYTYALMEKKEIIANDIVSCQEKTPYAYNPDISGFLTEAQIDFDGQVGMRCLDCHGANDTLSLNNRNAVLNWVSSRKPEASVLLDALSPLDGSPVAAYHSVDSSKIDMITSWIEGCLP